MRFLTKLLPKTLWGQLVSLLLLALIVSQLITLLIFVDTRRMLSNIQSESELISHIVGVVQSVEETTQTPNREFFASVSLPNLIFRGGSRPMRGRDSRPFYSAKLKAQLTAKLGDKRIRVVSEGDPRGQFIRRHLPRDIRISIKIRDNLWLHVTRVGKPPSMQWMAPLLLTMLLMMFFIVVIVSLLVRRLTKPLAALVQAAQKLGHGQNVDDLVEEGAEDVRKVTRSFNQMNQKIKRFVADRTKMLAAISHDLRTPITSLRLQAEFIEDKAMQSKMLETLEEMQMMTEAALKFSTDSAANEQTKEIDLESLLESMVNDYVDMDKQIVFVQNDSRAQVILPMRVLAMKRALRNLIDNGLKYGNKVEVDFELLKAQKAIEIYIRDDGNGIDQSEHEQVFEPFYRLEKSRNKETGGVGLGLSIARDIIRGHGGDVTVRNLKKTGDYKGLEVKITLPF